MELSSFFCSSTSGLSLSLSSGDVEVNDSCGRVFNAESEGSSTMKSGSTLEGSYSSFKSEGVSTLFSPAASVIE